MASMNPNPFVTSLEKSAAPRPAVPRPTPAAPAVPPSPPAPASLPPTAQAHAEASVLVAALVSPPREAAPALLAPVFTPPVEVPRARVAPVEISPQSTGSFGTWNEPTLSPDGTAGVRHALHKLRRAHLSRVVRAVVVSSAIVCALALVRVAVSVGRGSDPEVHCTSHVSMKPRPMVSTFATTHDDGDVIPPAASAHVTPKRAARHPASRSASRAHGSG